MWNHPIPLTTRHTYRFITISTRLIINRDIARPKTCYEDGRVDKFLNLISQLGSDLLKTHP